MVSKLRLMMKRAIYLNMNAHAKRRETRRLYLSKVHMRRKIRRKFLRSRGFQKVRMPSRGKGNQILRTHRSSSRRFQNLRIPRRSRRFQIMRMYNRDRRTLKMRTPRRRSRSNQMLRRISRRRRRKPQMMRKVTNE